MPQPLNETVFEELQFLDESTSQDGPWRVKAIGITLNEVNKNERLYPLDVARAAVDDANRRIDEGENIDGKVEHPDRPDLNGTAFNWLNLGIENNRIILEGLLLGTEAGRELRAMHKGKMKIRLSQRARGDTVPAGDHDKVTRFKIFGYDATGNPSDRHAGVTILESTKSNGGNSNMSELTQQISEFIEAQAGTFMRFDEATRARLAKVVKQQKPASFDEAKRLLENQAADYDALLETAKLNRDSENERLKAENEKLLEAQNRQKVDEFLAEAVKEAKYPETVEEAYLAAVKAGKPANIEEAKTLLEEQRAIFDPLAAKAKLNGRGFNSDRLQVTGPVIEKETGYPQFATVAFTLGQKLEESNKGQLWDPRKAQTPGQKLAARLLEAYDRKHRSQLLQESQLLEAETEADLAIPFSMVRAVIAQAYPMLVAASVFDFQMASKDPEQIGYEQFVGETGYSNTVTDEAINAGTLVDGQSAWIQLDNKAIVPGSETVTITGGADLNADGTNYVFDYARGRIKLLAGGSTAGVVDDEDFQVDYTYTAIAKGEDATIERAKLQLVWKTLESQPYRLAALITKEAIVRGQTQAGWDAVTRTIASLSQQTQTQIDEWVFQMALSAALLNGIVDTVDTSAQGAADLLIEAAGKAKVAVVNANYRPTAIVASASIADIMSNSERFSQAGNRPGDEMQPTGSVGRAKGLPVFEVGGGQFPDSFLLVCNSELVIHRVFQPMSIEGPFQVNDPTTGKLKAAQEYYLEEWNGSDAPVEEKGAVIGLS